MQANNLFSGGDGTGSAATCYAMLGFKFFEKFSDGLTSSVFHVFQPLTDAFLGGGESCNIEQALIGLGILHNGRSSFLRGKYQF